MYKLIFMYFCFLGVANAFVIDFDDITTNDTEIISSGYQTMEWGTDWSVMSNSLFSSVYQNTYTSISGNYAGFNQDGRVEAVLSGGSDFDFNGAYFSTLAFQDNFFSLSATSITVEGYNNNTLVGTVSMALSSNQYDWLQADLFGVDELRFISSGNLNWWLIDDLNISAVPEPASLVLLALGLAGVNFSRKMRIA